MSSKKSSTTKLSTNNKIRTSSSPVPTMMPERKSSWSSQSSSASSSRLGGMRNGNNHKEEEEEEMLLMNTLEKRDRHTSSNNDDNDHVDNDNHNDNNNDNDNENMNDRNNNNNNKGHDQTVMLQVLIILRRYILLMGNIFLWYITNGMHGIAMQSLSKKLEPTSGVDDNVEIHAYIDTFCMIVTTLLVTAIQLLVGAMLGCCLLWLHATFILQQKTTSSLSAFNLQHYMCSSLKTNPWDSILHGMGSIFTNFGFMYGSAAVVQIIKLLEPFETLLLTKALIPNEGKLLTCGIISSMLLTTGAAMGLIRSRKTNAPLPAILFAILSGLSLSTRNVLQRRQQQQQQQDGSGSNNNSSSRSISSTTSTSSTSAIVSKVSDVTTPPTKTTTTTTTMKVKKSALEGSLIQFTQLSLQSGVFIQIVTLVLYLVLLSCNMSFYRPSLTLALHQLNVRVFVWHPLYNAFSMITLGFCTAVTHSLWNAGKRVFAIVMAIVWFHEAFTQPTAMGLFLVFLGGCWYTMETNGIVLGGGSSGRTTTRTCTPTNAIKALLASVLVLTSHWMHTMQNVHDMIASAKTV